VAIQHQQQHGNYNMKTYLLYESREKLNALGAQNIYTDIAEPSGFKPAIASADLTEEQCKSLIPEGHYCYGKRMRCPFWDNVPHFPKQNNGYCHFLNRGDFQEEGLGLIWDSIKECGVNEYNNDYEE